MGMRCSALKTAIECAIYNFSSDLNNTTDLLLDEHIMHPYIYTDISYVTVIPIPHCNTYDLAGNSK